MERGDRKKELGLAWAERQSQSGSSAHSHKGTCELLMMLWQGDQFQFKRNSMGLYYEELSSSCVGTSG